MALSGKANPGMYSSKFIHKNIETEKGRYITIDDPYHDVRDKLPARWRKKQFTVLQIPMNAGQGFFGYGGKEPKAFIYNPEPYRTEVPYHKTEPPDKRKLGFGSHDASKRDEFTQAIRTEQYRETLRKEMKIVNETQAEQLVNQRKALEAWNARVTNSFPYGKKEIKHLYDVGRNQSTSHDPKNSRDQFYCMRDGARGRSNETGKRMGNFRTASQEVGEGVWAVKVKKPEFSVNHAHKNFYDKSHLQVQGF